jgi:SfnB family sulfur acquisition oxidoreductase
MTLPFAAPRLLGSNAEAIEAATAFAALIAPGAIERDRTAAHPVAELDQLARTGLLAINVPRAYGGPGLSYATVAEVYRIISAADPSLGQIPQNHFVYVEVLRAVGAEEQKRFFFGEVLRGARFGNAQTERGTRHAKAITAKLIPADGGSFRLDARKFYCTGALSAQWIPVLALDEAGRSVAAFVERHAPGVTVIDDWAAIGQRATASGTVVLSGVQVPAAHVIAHWRIFERPQAWTPIANLTHVAIDVGIAEAALADAAAFVRTRSRPWYEAGVERAGDDPLLLERFGRLAAKVHAARGLLDEAAALLDALPEPLDEETAAHASLVVGEAKAYAGDVAVEVANDLFALAGASAADVRHGLDRHWRNARTHTLHDPNRWRYHRLGDYFLNNRLPPNNRSN